MKIKKIRAVLEKYRNKLTRYKLYDGHGRYCVLGACLREYRVEPKYLRYGHEPRDAFLAKYPFDKSKRDAEFKRFRDMFDLDGGQEAYLIEHNDDDCFNSIYDGVKTGLSNYK